MSASRSFFILIQYAYCLLLIAYCLLLIAYCLLLIAHCLLPTHYSRFTTHYTSTLAYFAFASINARRGGTSSPISMLNVRSASRASSTPTLRNTRASGSMVVSQSCSAFISPRPLYRCTLTRILSRLRIRIYCFLAFSFIPAIHELFAF